MYTVLLFEVNCIFRKCFFCKKKVFDFFPKNSFHLKTLFCFFFEKIFKNSQNFFVKFLRKFRKFLDNLSKIFWHRQLLTKISAKFSRKFLPEISKNFRKFSKILPPFFFGQEISGNFAKLSETGVFRKLHEFRQKWAFAPEIFCEIGDIFMYTNVPNSVFCAEMTFSKFAIPPKKISLFSK